MKHCQLVIGPAGTGKSTYCRYIQEHCEASKRTVHVANLDPAAENFEYHVAFDIKDLITLDDVMDELKYGPNGGLVYCMEYLLENLDWLQDELDNFGDDDYIIFDCPGQIELYSHIPVMKQLGETLKMWGFNVCAVYLIDSLFIADPSKFISGVLCSLSAMVLTKCDLVDKQELEKYLDGDSGFLLHNINRKTTAKLRTLNNAICDLLTDYNMVSFLPMDIHDEESMETVLAYVDNLIQYGEDVEPKDPYDEAPDLPDEE